MQHEFTRDFVLATVLGLVSLVVYYAITRWMRRNADQKLGLPGDIYEYRADTEKIENAWWGPFVVLALSATPTGIAIELIEFFFDPSGARFYPIASIATGIMFVIQIISVVQYESAAIVHYLAMKTLSAPNAAKLAMAVEALMATTIFSRLQDTGLSEKDAMDIVESMARSEVFQETQKDAVAQAAIREGVRFQTLEKYHLVEALIGFHEAHGDKAAADLVRSNEYPVIENLVRAEIMNAGNGSIQDKITSLEMASAEAYRLQEAAIMNLLPSYAKRGRKEP